MRETQNKLDYINIKFIFKMSLKYKRQAIGWVEVICNMFTLYIVYIVYILY